MPSLVAPRTTESNRRECHRPRRCAAPSGGTGHASCSGTIKAPDPALGRPSCAGSSRWGHVRQLDAAGSCWHAPGRPSRRIRRLAPDPSPGLNHLETIVERHHGFGASGAITRMLTEAAEGTSDVPYATARGPGHHRSWRRSQLPAREVGGAYRITGGASAGNSQVVSASGRSRIAAHCARQPSAASWTRRSSRSLIRQLTNAARREYRSHSIPRTGRSNTGWTAPPVRAMYVPRTSEPDAKFAPVRLIVRRVIARAPKVTVVRLLPPTSMYRLLRTVHVQETRRCGVPTIAPAPTERSVAIQTTLPAWGEPPWSRTVSPHVGLAGDTGEDHNLAVQRWIRTVGSWCHRSLRRCGILVASPDDCITRCLRRPTNRCCTFDPPTGSCRNSFVALRQSQRIIQLADRRNSPATEVPTAQPKVLQTPPPWSARVPSCVFSHHPAQQSPQTAIGTLCGN